MRRGGLTVEEEVRRLAPLGLAELRMVWTERIGAPPTLRSPDLLRLMLPWRMQAGAMGGIDADLRCQLARRGRAVVEGQSLGHGAILRRIWQGRLIEAIVEDGGSALKADATPAPLPSLRPPPARAGMDRGSSA